MPEVTANPSHYVYLYSDLQGHPKYVGYGERPSRATVHLTQSHNPGLAKFLASSKFTIRVSGPFPTESIGKLVESALISALGPEFNVAPGLTAARFRPLGVPIAYAERSTSASLTRADFLAVQGTAPLPVLFVSVGSEDFDDGRVGYDLANPPSDAQVRERTDRWWQLHKFLPHWILNPAESPGLLVGIYGTPGAQLIIASLLIDRSAWANAEKYLGGGGKVSVPLHRQDDLDAFGLRGRSIDKGAGIAFEGVAAGFFAVLRPDGELIGGRRKRRAGV